MVLNYVSVIQQHLSSGCEDKQTDPQSGHSVFLARFKIFARHKAYNSTASLILKLNWEKKCVLFVSFVCLFVCLFVVTG